MKKIKNVKNVSTETVEYNSSIIQLPLPKSRNIFLASQVDQSSINNLTKEIIEINNSDRYIEMLAVINNMVYKPGYISIYIDSYGGSVYQCFGLLGVIENSKTPIKTIVTGCAMSCGFVIAISGHKRLAYPKSTFMYHQVSNFVEGKSKDIEEDLIETKRLQKMIESHTLEHTKISKKQLEENYKLKKDWYLNSKKALKLGVIDEII